MKSQTEAFLSLFTVDHTEKNSHPWLMGNGEFVTAFGPSGYHTDEPLPGMQVFCMAGRRISGPTQPLLRLGQIKRTVVVAGRRSDALSWTQTLNPADGTLHSRLTHSKITEETVSFVCLDTNAAVFHTTLTNTGSDALSGEFRVAYRFGDWAGNLPDDSLISLGQPESGMAGRVVYFEVEKRHLGGVDLTSDGQVTCEDAAAGVDLSYPFALAPGASDSVTFVLGVGDKLRYRYTRLPWTFEDLYSKHLAAWQDYHATSRVSLGDDRLDALRLMCLYDLRCNSTPWSIPPAVSPSQWEGRAFHDELYPFLGLASSGHAALAHKIPQYRLGTLQKAVERSAFRGAKYAWESTESGEDGSPYGAFLEEHFHMGQFAEEAWQWCLYDGGEENVTRFFPMFREIARYWVLNIVEMRDGRYGVKPVTDYDEAIYPVANGLYTMCAAIRSLEIAAAAARGLGVSVEDAHEWEMAAAGLREALPRTANDQRYLTCEAAEHRHVAEVGPVFPFRIDPFSAIARRTLDSFCEAVRTDSGLQPGNLPNYGGSRWLWTCAHAATAYAIAGDGECALEILQDAPAATAPGLVPCEQVSRDGHISLPFFTTSAGAFVFSINSLFIQITDEGVTRITGCPIGAPQAEFHDLAGAGGLRVSGRFKEGKLVWLQIASPSPRAGVLDVATGIAEASLREWPCVGGSWESDGWLRLELSLDHAVHVWEAVSEA